jgi:MFS superfamily sulfate permease-like transporter
MPLCMGIAVASGVPAERGLVTGIIGGIIVGALAGSPLQVSGPAAGLAVIVFEIVSKHGLSMLGPILLLAGLIQLIAGAAKLGNGSAPSLPAVVHGMLAGIGVLIVAGQIHVLFGDTPKAHGLQNLAAIPAPWPACQFCEPRPGRGRPGGRRGDDRLDPGSGRSSVPRAEAGPGRSARRRGRHVVLAAVLGLDVQRIVVPESIAAAIAVPAVADFGRCPIRCCWLTALAVAFIASAETLLSAAAVDRMHDGPRTKYNKELFAQGVGNMLCGAAGALPMTGVIVRSSANVQAGAVTRLSAILHGVWILAFVALLPWLLRRCPAPPWPACWWSPAGSWSAWSMSATCSPATACCRR